MNIFFKWFNQTKSNKERLLLSAKKEKHFLEMKSIWEKSSEFSIPEYPDTQQEWISLQRKIRIAESGKEKKSINPFLIFFSKPQYVVAFSCVLLAFLITTVVMMQMTNPTDYITANKQKSTVVLQDSSIVQLNSGSRLSVPVNFGKNTRTVSLEGEAYFEVENGPLNFIIHTDIGQITVLGTKFNVRSRYPRMEVIVNEGMVEVTSTTLLKDSSVIITKGEMVLCKAGQYPDLSRSVGINQYPGWLNNKMTLRESELSEVFREIEHRFDVRIIQDDKQLDQLKISGLFEASDLDSLMSSVCNLIEKEYRSENDKIIIYDIEDKKGKY